MALSQPQLVAELQRQLASRPWLAESDHWAMAAELAGLFEELGRSLVSFPGSEAELADLFGRACEARAGGLLRLDAQLVHQLWVACEGQPEWGLSAWQRDALAMKRLLDAPEGPLWVFDAGPTTPQAADFYQRYARHAPVTLLRLDASASSRAAWVCAALGGTDAALVERAQQWGAADSEPPGGLRVYAALGREGEAAHVCDTVCEWLAQGEAEGRTPSIAVVATDRALARRLRALLERRGVLAEDKAGWYLATTRVGAAVRDLLRLQRRPTPALLLACLDSPLVAAADRVALRGALGRALAAQPPHTLLDWQALNLAAAGEPPAADWLAGLQRALLGIGERPRALADWIGALLDALAGLAPELGCDPAGAQLLAHLERSRTALARHSGARQHADLCDWLDWTLGETLFRDDPVDSPVLLTHPGALRGLSFDAIVVAGADAAHLPAPLPRLRVVRDAARAELGLPDAAARRARAVEDWCLLMGGAPRIEITVQALDDRGEPVPASPFLLMMQRFHQLAWGQPLHASEPFARRLPSALPALLPVERAGGGLQMPAALSPTGYQTLLDCPYRFYVREWLHLRAAEEAAEGMEPRDVGVAIHAILNAFHGRMPVLQAAGRTAALAALEAVTDEVFAPLLTRDFGAAAWLARWRSVVPAYIEWQLAREADGWRVEVAMCEESVEGGLTVSVPGSGGPAPAEGGATRPAVVVRLHGKTDRVDRGPGRGASPDDGATAAAARRAVIDYKTGSRKNLETLEKDPSEDGQLVLYAHMVPLVSEVAYLPLGSDALDKGALKPVTLAGENLARTVDGHLARLSDTFARIDGGESLPAIGDERACSHCDAAGLCRREHRAAPRTA